MIFTKMCIVRSSREEARYEACINKWGEIRAMRRVLIKRTLQHGRILLENIRCQNYDKDKGFLHC